MASQPTSHATIVRLEKVKRISLRQEIAEGILPELEFCLLSGGDAGNASKRAKKLKKAGREDVAALRQAERAAAQARREEGLSWTSEDKEALLNMEIETLRCVDGFAQEFEVEVRSLCHSRGVTADYLDRYERFNMKQVVLVLGNVGKSREPWAELVHPAMYLHRHEFNILWLDIPSFRSNQAYWMKFGPVVLRTLLRSYCLQHVSVLACGLGGAVFLEAMAKAPDLFGSTHLIYNMDLPSFKGPKPKQGQRRNQKQDQFNLSIADLEDILRVKELQLWLTYLDNEETFDRFKDGSPMRAYDAMTKLQARLQGERERGRRSLPYDELLITENLNINPVRPLIDERQMGLNNLLVFSEPFLVSMANFLESVPCGRQKDLDGGLVGDYRAAALSKAMKGEEALPDGDVLPALRRLRVATDFGLADRPRMAETNRYRLPIVDTAVRYLSLSETTDLHPALLDMGFTYTNITRGTSQMVRRSPGNSSRPSSRGSSVSGTRGASKIGSREKDRAHMSKNASSPALLAVTDDDRRAGHATDDQALEKREASEMRDSLEKLDLAASHGPDKFFGDATERKSVDVMEEYRKNRSAWFAQMENLEDEEDED